MFLPYSRVGLENGMKRLRDLMLRFMCVLLRDVRRHLIPQARDEKSRLGQDPDLSLPAIFDLERFLTHSEMQAGGEEMRDFLSSLTETQNFAHFVSRMSFPGMSSLEDRCLLAFFTSAADLVQLQAHAISKSEATNGARIIKKAATEMRRSRTRTESSGPNHHFLSEAAAGLLAAGGGADIAEASKNGKGNVYQYGTVFTYSLRHF